MKLKFLSLLVLTTIYSAQSFAQIPLNVPSKEDRRLKKIEKSEARDEIKK
jgi:hypothetical protein